MKDVPLLLPTGQPVVYIVDDDDVVRESLLWLVDSTGRQGVAYSNPIDFLQAIDPDRPGCLILDMRMAHMTGFDVQDELARQNISLPIIFITGHGGVPMSVRAMKNGAFDFIEKPYNYRQMLDSIEEALRKGGTQFQRGRERARARALLASLSPRERAVLEKTVEGKPVKIIAYELGIAVKTVEFYRTSIREKLGVDSVAQILHIVTAASSSPDFSRI